MLPGCQELVGLHTRGSAEWMGEGCVPRSLPCPGRKCGKESDNGHQKQLASWHPRRSVCAVQWSFHPTGGSVSETVLHGDVSFAHGCMRSGHSTGTTVDSHLDKNNVAHGIEAARARSACSKLKERDHLLRLDLLGLGNHTRVHQFTAELHKVTIDNLQHRINRGLGWGRMERSPKQNRMTVMDRTLTATSTSVQMTFRRHGKRQEEFILQLP